MGFKSNESRLMRKALKKIRGDWFSGQTVKSLNNAEIPMDKVLNYNTS
jgi:hypothetical protein